MSGLSCPRQGSADAIAPPCPLCTLRRRASKPRRPDWGAALGNAENAKLAVSALRDMLADAVFLDEEAFAGAGTLQLYQQRMQVGARGGARARCALWCVCVCVLCLCVRVRAVCSAVHVHRAIVQRAIQPHRSRHR